MKQMKSVLKFSIIVALSICSAPLSAAVNAQTTDQSQAMERMDRIEHDLMLLHRQLARGEAVPAASGGDAGTANPAQLEVRLSAIEDQLRELRGKTEENENSARKVADALTKFQKDTEFRFSELAPPIPPATTQPVVAKIDGKQPTISAPSQAIASTAGTLRAPDNSAKSGGDAASEQTNFASPREHYNYAFRLLNQTQYEESAAAFEAFTKKYPKDPLVGNAFYWEGETFYIRRDYVNAADNFRKGFEALPEGPKAADNLLKLAMSLNAVSRDKEACLVLQQVVSKFKKTSASVSDKAEQEQKRIGCQK